MSTFLLVGVGEAGQALPMLSMAQALAQRGHRALAFFDEKFKDGVEAAGAEFMRPRTYQNPFEYLKSLRDGRRSGLAGRLRAFRRTRKWMVKVCVPSLVRDLEEVIRREGVDCVVSCITGVGARYAAERTGTPFVSVTPNPLFVMNQEGRLISYRPSLRRLIPAWFVRRLMDAVLPLRTCRSALGLPPIQSGHAGIIDAIISDTLHLVTVPPGFLPEKSMLRAAQLCVGPMSFNLPAHEKKPFPVESLAPGTVLVSTSTLPVDPALFRRTLEAVDLLDIPILATAAGATDLPKTMGAKVRIEPFVPHDDVLSHVAALVTHGGWGIVGRALRHGVPMLIISLLGDQPVIGFRLAQMGLAYHLPRKRATTEAIRQAVTTVLKDDALKLRVQAYAQELRSMNSSRLVADALEEIVRK